MASYSSFIKALEQSFLDRSDFLDQKAYARQAIRFMREENTIEQAAYKCYMSLGTMPRNVMDALGIIIQRAGEPAPVGATTSHRANLIKSTIHFINNADTQSCYDRLMSKDDIDADKKEFQQIADAGMIEELRSMSPEELAASVEEMLTIIREDCHTEAEIESALRRLDPLPEFQQMVRVALKQ